MRNKYITYMKKGFCSVLFFIFLVSTTNAQKDPWLPDFLERWEQSKAYMLAVAEAMPEEKYGFKPATEMMGFGEQLMHIALVIEWHAHSRFADLDTPFRQDAYKADGMDKASIIKVLEKEFDKASQLIKGFEEDRLSEKGSYGSFYRTRRQFLLLLADHVSHHRGQLLVYLRLNDIPPPDYVKFQ